MSAGAPGTNPIVTNSGTAEAAVLDFTIPSGNTGAAGIADVLAANNDTDQATAADTAVTFANTLTTSGTAISHTPGSADVTINTEGVYQVTFNAVATLDAGGSPPETLTFTATLNGTDVPGATASHIYNTASETSTLVFSVPITVTTAPATLNVEASAAGFTINDADISVLRLGNTP